MFIREAFKLEYISINISETSVKFQWQLVCMKHQNKRENKSEVLDLKKTHNNQFWTFKK